MKHFLSRIAVVALTAGSVAALGVTTAWAATTVPTVVLKGGSAVFGISPGAITATASVPGTVNFTAGGTTITDCSAVATTTVTPFVAVCTWTPSAVGAAVLGATLTPTDTVNYTTATAAPFNVVVGTPVQGVQYPISLYVDTVLGSGATGPLKPQFGAGCGIASNFIVGQTIVFRVYANDAARGGAPLTSLNVSSATVTVSGVATPIPLSFGNHSGGAFWTGVLKTGTAAGLYNTLGIINYKVAVNTIAVPAVTKQVKTIKYVPTMKNKKHVVVNGKGVFQQVTYLKTVIVTPAVPGATGTFQTTFVPSSQLTLNALPA
jgi:hypothetical protein